MNAEEFAQYLKTRKKISLVQSLIEGISMPAGRNISSDRITLASWYNNLTEKDRLNVNKIIDDSVDASIFSVLCVLDNVSSAASHGEFVLFFRNDNVVMQINSPNGEMLHDIFNRS